MTFYKNDQFIKEFRVETKELSENEKKVLEKLTAAAKLVAPIYKKQQNPTFEGANFYPHDTTKAEIEEAAKKNPKILDPYTIVKKRNGKLTAVPYHIEYKSEVAEIAKLILEAAALTDNDAFCRRLELQAEALLNGTYPVADVYWLTMKPYKIDIVIGPIERYDDKLFFTKCAYQSWVGLIEETETKEATKFQNTIYLSHRRRFEPFHKVDFLDKIQVRVDKTLIFSGLIARYGFTSTNLPNDLELMEKFGSEITIFTPSFEEKFEKLHYPIFRQVFEENFQTSYSSDILKRGSLHNTILHEISHPLMRYRGSEFRLKELFPIFDEILASVYGVKACGILLLKNVISQKELEAIMVMFICKAFSWWCDYLKEPTTIYYTKGYAIALNYFLKNESLKETGGISWPNFSKLFASFDELAEILEKLLSVGSYKEAKGFVDQYGSFDVFRQFQPKLNPQKSSN
jgi:hypothetical protein